MKGSKFFLSMFFISSLLLSACSRTYLLTEDYYLEKEETVNFNNYVLTIRGSYLVNVKNDCFEKLIDFTEGGNLVSRRKTQIRKANSALFVNRYYLYVYNSSHVRIYNKDLTLMYVFDIDSMLFEELGLDITNNHLSFCDCILFDNNFYYYAKLYDNNDEIIKKTFFVFDTSKDEFVFPTYYEDGDIVYINDYAFSIKNNEIYPLEDDYEYHVRSFEYNNKDGKILFTLPTESRLCSFNQNVNGFYMQDCRKQIKEKFYFVLSKNIIDERYFKATSEHINKFGMNTYSYGLFGDTYLYCYNAVDNSLTIEKNLGYGAFVIGIDDDLNVKYYKNDIVYNNDISIASLNIKHENRTATYNWFSGFESYSFYANHYFTYVDEHVVYRSEIYNSDAKQWELSAWTWI